MRRDGWENLHRDLTRAYASSQSQVLGFDRERQFIWGYETRRRGETYRWVGHRRGDNRSQARVLFQFTLRGCGEYAEASQIWRVTPGKGFLVLLPSAHCYSLPPDAGEWTFFWIMVYHPYFVERVRTLRRRELAVQEWPIDSPVLAAAVDLFKAACHGQLHQVWPFEKYLFSWLFEMERVLLQRRYPASAREKLLDATRQIVVARLGRPPNAAELAAIHHEERTTFARKFKATTGKTPAAFTMEIRLEAALRLLREGAKLEEIARRTGFADANHFIKVFRRHFHSAPGAYRQNLLR